jgi:hypothetical protein
MHDEFCVDVKTSKAKQPSNDGVVSAVRVRKETSRRERESRPSPPDLTQVHVAAFARVQFGRPLVLCSTPLVHAHYSR